MNDYDDIPDGDDLFYTVIKPDEPKIETKINISYRKTNATGYAVMDIGVHSVMIGAQQIAELGVLLLGIAAKLDPNVDLDSGLELLDGYEIPVPNKQFSYLAEN